MSYFKLIFCFLFIFLTILPWNVTAGTQPTPLDIDKCNAFLIYGKPTETTDNSTIICRTGYLLAYDIRAKIPIWVTYMLKPHNTIGCFSRSNAFSSDQSLKSNEKSTVEDYAHSGYDTGHLAPAGDMAWDETVERESFILSNTGPQTPELNRGPWKMLETAVRSWAYNSGNDLIIYAGPIYDIKENIVIGPNRVTVPHAYYKIVIDTNKKQTLAFIFENSKLPGKDLNYYQVNVLDVERATGIEFNIPDDKSVKNNIWTINTILLSAAKKQKCKN